MATKTTTTTRRRRRWRWKTELAAVLAVLAVLLAVLVATATAEAEAEAEAGRRRSRGRKDEAVARMTRRGSSSSSSSSSRHARKQEKSVPEDDDSSGGGRKRRKGRFFPLFSIVQFRNDPCASTTTGATSGLTRNGTCYTSTECSDKGGSASGNCAAGFGTCCVFINTDGSGTIDENCTYVQNPSYPSADTGEATVTYTVGRCSNDVCFLRLDFETFTIQGAGATDATNEGVCLDTFTVTTGTSQMVPTICGTNTGYHMYVDIGAEGGDTASLAFALSGAGVDRMWDVKITQLECSNANAPPDTCLQYHTGLMGRIETFNYQATGDNHLNNQQYNVCVRPAAGYCCVQYQLCSDQAAADAMSLDPSITTSANDDACDGSDYLSIPESSNVCQESNVGVNSRYCGQFLNFNGGLMANDVVCDCTAPFLVGIFTDGVSDEGMDAMNTIQSRGLCLEYTQVAC